MGKEKGLDQSCWERRLTDPNKTYKVDELKEILSACTDFQQESSQLQKIGGEVGVNVTYSPKCHPENSGEGIEFIWALIKNKYRRIPFSLKPKEKKAFLKDVAKLVHDTAIEKVRKSSERARQFICAYNEIHNGTFQGPVPMRMIEKYKSTSYKSHRGVLISDVSFVEAEM
jgi:hypothetical protein